MRPRLPEKITYWTPGPENKFGQRSYSAPVILDGRWEDKVETIRLPSGEEVVSNSKVYTDREVIPSGYVYRGISSVASPLDIAGPIEIRQVGSTPSLSNLSRLWTAFL